MGAPEFPPSGSQYLAIQRARLHMLPKALAGQLMERDRSQVRDRGAKPVAVQHPETTHFPAPPFSDVAQEPDRDVRQTQIKIDEIGRAFSVDIASLYNHVAITPPLFRDRVDF